MVDWSKLTPREVWDSLKSAPKVAGPWEVVPGSGPTECRRDLTGRVVAVDGLWVLIGALDSRVPNSGKDDADDVLRKNGWVLV